MGKGLPRSHTRGEFASGASSSGVLLVPAGISMVITGAAGNGFGTAVISDFPEGNILFLGCVSYLTFAGTGSDADLGDTWEGDYAVGTTATVDATLGGTDADIVPTTALAAATAEVSPRTRGTQADGALGGAVFDNTDGSLEINVNLSIDDADIAGDDSVITVAGELYIKYAVLGDD